MFDIVEEFSEKSEHFSSDRVRDPNGRLKRFFDVLFSLVFLLTFLPLLCLIALLIWCTSGNMPVFAHERIGRGGRKFKCLKFRTMVRDADQALKTLLETSPEAAREWAKTRKLRNDPRILPFIGAVLRKSSLDELPQIINVLRGDMSIVGPRPIVEDELELYGQAQHLYLSVRPGLTGPWQAGNRSNDSYENRIRLDSEYVRNWDMRTDFRIILKTAKIFLKGGSSGAY